MMRGKTSLLWYVAVLVVIFVPPAGAQTTVGQTKVSIIHFVSGLSGIPLWIAHEYELFAKQGIDALSLVDQTGGVSRRITGDIPFGVLGIPAVIQAVAEGRHLKVLVSLQSARADSELVARPDVKTPEDLRGKRVGFTRVGTGFWIYAILALEHLGLDPQRDRISLVEVEGDLPRLVQALEAGEIDAAVLDPAQSTQLKAKGFSLLLDMYPANISAVQNALVVAGPYLREHPDVVEKVVAGLLEGIAFSLSPAKKETVLKTLMAHLNISDPAAAERGYESFLSRVNRRPYASISAIQNMQRVMALNDPKVLNVKVEDLVEDRFVRRLDESGVIDRFYSIYGVR